MKAIVSPQNLHRSKQRKAVLKNGKNATKKHQSDTWLGNLRCDKNQAKLKQRRFVKNK